MKVLFVLANGGRGGMQRVVTAVAHGLVAAGHEAVIAVGGAAPLDADVEVLRMHAFNGRTGGLAFHRDLRRAIVRLRPDVVHGHGLRLALALGRFGVRRPVALTSHGGPKSSYRSAAFALRLLPIQTIACGVGPQAALAAVGVSATVIPVGVDPVPQVATKDELAARYDLEPTQPLIVVPARLTPQKDPHLVLAALERCAHVQAIFFGDGPLEASLADEVAVRGLTDRVRFAGFVPNVAGLLGGAHAVVLGSQYEGHVLAGLEAMAAGVPFVATACVGIADWATSGEDCLLSPVGDAEALATNLRSVLNDGILAAHLVAGGRATAATYSSAAMVAAHLALYEDLVAR